jgi:putative heme-binding domain-containing protein
MWVSVLVILLAQSVPVGAQHGNITSGNPASSPEDRAAGARLFRIQCAGCHGLDGSGGAGGSNLTTGLFRHGSADEALFRNIAKGIPGTAMTGTQQDGRQIWQLVTFVRSLSLGRGAEQAKGDPAKGERLFQSSGCIRCHTVSGKGGLLGPDLSDIGSRRNLADLERSLLAPNADVAPEFWSLHAQTKGVEKIVGTLLNEDTYSFQIRDSTGALKSVLKDDLRQHDIVRTSPMPAFPGTPAELSDLIAYLATQRSTNQ